MVCLTTVNSTHENLEPSTSNFIFAANSC
jgi:hypothetical protein